MPKITPFLWYDAAEEAMPFSCSLFEDSEIHPRRRLRGAIRNPRQLTKEPRSLCGVPRHRSTTLFWRSTMHPTVHSLRTPDGVSASEPAS
jgi:hypothetical protein